jgi:hypothetical protein
MCLSLLGLTQDHQPGGRRMGRRGEIGQGNDALHGDGMRCLHHSHEYRGSFHGRSTCCSICYQLCTWDTAQDQGVLCRRHSCTPRQPNTVILIWTRRNISVNSGRISQDTRADSRSPTLALNAWIREAPAPSHWVDVATGVGRTSLRREVYCGSASGCGQVALMRAARSVPDVLQAIPSI